MTVQLMQSAAAFISYSHRDDEAHGGKITELRKQLAHFVGVATGQDFEIFQDRAGIAWGQHWPSRLDEALEQALFLIPILTPSYFNSEACRKELEKFLELERRTGRNDLILPIYFRTARVFQEKNDPLAAKLSERQYRDWRELRHKPVQSPESLASLDALADEIEAAIYRTHARISAAALPIAPASQAVLGLDPRAHVHGSADQAQPERITEDNYGPRIKPEHDKGKRAPPLLIGDPGPNPAPGTVFKDIDASWCPEMVVIPPGEFIMGSTKDERRWAVEQEAASGNVEVEKPQHRVRIGKRCAVGVYPVTFDNYDRFADATGRDKPKDEGWGRARRPVINVSWEDAKAYVAWLSKQTGQPYRLLSEAEWEYAARADTTTRHWWGDDISRENTNYRDSDIGNTTEVGAYPANPWGLYDMNGNVWEWGADCWNKSYDGAPNDGSVWERGNCDLRIIRGGSWKSVPGILRAAYRNRGSFRKRENNIGFRVARTLTR